MAGPEAPTSSATTEAVERCPVCGQLTGEKLKCIVCGTCGRYVHFHCFEHGKISAEIIKIMKTSPNVIKVTCRACNPAGIRGKIIPLNPTEDSTRQQQIAVEKSRAQSASEEAKRANEKVLRLKQQNTQLMVEQTKAGDHIGTLNARVHELQTANTDKDNQIAIFLSTTATGQSPSGKRVRTNEGERFERSMSENRGRAQFSTENLDAIIQRALGPMQAQIENIVSQLRDLTMNVPSNAPVNAQRVSRPPSRMNFQGPPLQGSTRPRSQSNKQKVPNLQKVPNIAKKSFAEVVNANKGKMEAIRNIKINVEEPERINQVNDRLNKLNIKGIQIKSIARKSKDFLTVKCVNAADAVIMEDSLAAAFGDDLLVSSVKSSVPRVKIVDIGLEGSIDNDYLVSILKSQNHWLRNMNFELAEIFKVPGSKREYVNVILQCDIVALKAFLERGSVIVGFAEKRVYEHINILQCFNCQRFGHVAASCKVTSTCRFCASNAHESKDCEDKTLKVCANCLRENKKGSKFNTSHRATDERCPSRAARIAALKALAAKN